LKKQDYIYSLQRGSGQPHVYGKDLEKIKIAIPPIDLQNQFADYAKTCDKLKFEAQERLEELKATRESLIDKYFR
jgi:restriction endonuclease S subunit